MQPRYTSSICNRFLFHLHLMVLASRCDSKICGQLQPQHILQRVHQDSMVLQLLVEMVVPAASVHEH